MTEVLASRIDPTHGMKGAKRWGYITRQKTIRLATTNEDGSIYLSPLWFVVHDKRIYLPLDAGSRHATNSAAGRALAAVIDSGDEYATVHGIRFTGSLKPVEDKGFYDTAMGMIFEKYFYDGHPYAEAYFQFGLASGRQIVELVTKKAIGWDMREISVPAMPEARVLPEFVTDRILPD
jgi:nitroimidazol reductase NimA-like FMN-containing flavoprotein (pyridoxamine 5'-phosphate oxidase superfamily)